MPTVPLAQYLFTRLRQLGIQSVFGVPSDYNLRSLDYIAPAGLRWIGDANELNAGYAADGYARVNGIACVMTAFGVGELSAINAIAGSYAEYVPVIHVVGAPSRHIQQARACVHHSLGNGDFEVFKRVAADFTVAQASLIEPETSPAEIDRALREALMKRRPVYLVLPVDMIAAEVDASPLKSLNWLELENPPNYSETVQETAQRILERLLAARQPALIVDSLAHSFRLRSELDDLVNTLRIPVFVTPGGRGAINEKLSAFRGLYAGAGSVDTVIREYVDKSDLILTVGSLPCDFSTCGFTNGFDPKNNIFIDCSGEVRPADVIARLTETAATASRGWPGTLCDQSRELENGIMKSHEPNSHNPLSQQYLWSSLSRHLLPHDIVLTENGTSSLGLWSTKLPEGAVALLQPLWGSIGYALPAAQGAAIAALESSGAGSRVVLFQGDGSFQLTSAAISTIAKHRLDLVFVLLNNAGYTIERFVHPSGFNEDYNDIADWDYATVIQGLCGGTKKAEGYLKLFQVRTVREWETVMSCDDIRTGKGLRFVEVILPKEDAPKALKLLTQAADKRNRGGGRIV